MGRTANIATHTEAEKPARRSSRHVPRLILVPAIGAFYFTSACGLDLQDDTPEEYDYVAVCADPRTGNRVEDDQCSTAPQEFNGGTEPSFLWFYVPTSGSYTAPPVGQRIAGTAGSYTTPKTGKGGAPAIQRGGTPRSGGAITRGGFGSSGKAGSGGS